MMPLNSAPRRGRASCRRALALLILAAILPGAAHSQTRTWILPGTGYWSATANWADGQVPDTPAEAALIPNAMGNCSVLLDANQTLGAVTVESPAAWLYLGGFGLWLTGAGGLTNHGTVIANTGASTLQGAIHNQAGGQLRVRGGSSLALPGPGVTNDGTVLVNDQSTTLVADLEFPNDLTLQGSGDVWLAGTSPWAQVNTAPTATLTNGAGHTIHGTGDVNARLANQGVVSADWAAQVLALKGEDKLNTGVMKATGDGWLAIDGVRVENIDGEIQADGGHVLLRGGAVIHGGELSGTGGYGFYTESNCRFEGVTSRGAVKIRAGDTLTVAGPGLVNDGQCVVNHSSSTLPSDLRFEGSVTLAGSGDVLLAAVGPWARVSTASGGVLTNAAGHTIHGVGDVTARLVNQGLVSADWAAQVLALAGEAKTNTGVMKATGDGWLAIDGVRVENIDGEIQANGGNVLLRNGAAIHGGELSGTGGYAFYTEGNAGLDNVTNLGLLRIGAGTTVMVAAPQLTNEGTITINHQSSTLQTYLNCQGDVTLAGSGDVWLAATSPWARLASTPGSRVTNGAEHLIHGVGDVTARLTNRGTIRADWPGQMLAVTSPEFKNLGVVEARDGAVLAVTSPAGNYTGGTLVGGTWRVMAGSWLRLVGASILRNSAAIVLDGAGSYLVRDYGTSDALANFRFNLADGFFTIRNGRAFAASTQFENAGQLTVGKGSVFQAPAAGAGFTQTATGTLRFEIAGRAAGEYGRLTVAGAASMAGVLAAEFAGGFEPAPGDTFLVATYASVTGDFDHFESPVVNGLRLAPTVYARRIVLTALPPGVDVAQPAVPLPERLALGSRTDPAGGALLELALPVDADLRLELFDLQGRRVAGLWQGPRPAGVARFPVTAGELGLARGVYFARAEVRAAAGRQVRTARVVVLR